MTISDHWASDQGLNSITYRHHILKGLPPNLRPSGHKMNIYTNDMTPSDPIYRVIFEQHYLHSDIINMADISLAGCSWVKTFTG